MKKIILGLWVGALVLASSTAMAAEGSLVYENRLAGVRMSYPADWVKSEALPATLVAFGVPKDKANLKMVENVRVSAQELTPEISSLEKYTAMYEAQRAKDPIGPIVLESKKTTLGGLPAQRIVCVGKQKDMDIKFLQVWAVKGNKAYLLTYGSSKETYDKFINEAEKIIASFTLI